MIGALLLALAFLPKPTALLIAIPPAVAAAYIIVLLGLLFMQGMQLMVRDGVDHRTTAVAGVSFWLGVAFQNGWVFPGLIKGGFTEVLLDNGMAAGNARGHAGDGLHRGAGAAPAAAADTPRRQGPRPPLAVPGRGRDAPGLGPRLGAAAGRGKGGGARRP